MNLNRVHCWKSLVNWYEIMINILIVDDSMTETIILKNLFEMEDDFRVIGCAQNGKEAIEMVARLKPDLITMDILMPIMDGLEATQKIMSQHPTPIVVISSKLDDREINTTFQALEAGALSVLEKPKGISSPNFHSSRKNIVNTVRAMSEIKVIKRRFPDKKSHQSNIISTNNALKEYELIAIGASVGGPQVLKKILSNLPADFPIPILIVQHMTPGFINGFTQWLNENVPLRVKNAEHQEELRRGAVYFAPDHFHLEVTRVRKKLVANLVKSNPVSGFCPSATVLLNSVAKVCKENAIGILLTGMGSDGAQGLWELKKVHGHTLIQDPKSTVVFGMAGVAQSLGAVDKVIEIDQFADYLLKITKKYD